MLMPSNATPLLSVNSRQAEELAEQLRSETGHAIMVITGLDALAEDLVGYPCWS